jgi:TetR/AcrR family transcriptional repressor of mexJK operon
MPGRPSDQRKRQAIIEAAARAFFAHGYEAASIEAIAADASVSKVTIYAHFGDKGGLLSAAVEAECAKMRAGLMPDAAEGPLRDRLIDFGRAMLAFLSRPEIIQFERRIAAETEREPDLGQRFLNAGPRRMLHALAEMISAAHRDGALQVDDPLLAAGHLAAMFKGMADMERRFASPESPEAGEARLRSAVDLFLRAHRA